MVFTDVSCLEKHVKILDHLVNMAKENVANTVEIDTPTGDPCKTCYFSLISNFFSIFSPTTTTEKLLQK